MGEGERRERAGGALCGLGGAVAESWCSGERGVIQRDGSGRGAVEMRASYCVGSCAAGARMARSAGYLLKSIDLWTGVFWLCADGSTCVWASEMINGRSLGYGGHIEVSVRLKALSRRATAS